MTIEFNGIFYDDRHGGPFDRGSADSYYMRGPKPHHYPEGTFNGEIVTEERMTPEELNAYYAGYDWNEKYGDHKSYD